MENNADKQKALHDVAENGMIEDVKKYLNDDTIDVNWKYYDDWGRLSIVLVPVAILKSQSFSCWTHGADTEVRTDNNDTPLLLAFEEGHLSTTKFLLDRGANIDVCNGGGRNPLHVAIESGQESTVKLLLDRGWPINVVDEDGDTPLHFACCNNYKECAAELLVHGADIMNVCADSWTEYPPVHSIASITHDVPTLFTWAVRFEANPLAS